MGLLRAVAGLLVDLLDLLVVLGVDVAREVSLTLRLLDLVVFLSG